MSEDTEPYEPLYLEGIALFNVCDFFEAHESWETLWADTVGPNRRFYQGLIQVAVCLHHFGNGNLRGAKKLYHSSLAYLADYRPHHAGLDLDQFCQELDACCQPFLGTAEEFPRGEIDPQLVPEIHLNPSPE